MEPPEDRAAQPDAEPGPQPPAGAHGGPAADPGRGGTASGGGGTGRGDAAADADAVEPAGAGGAYGGADGIGGLSLTSRLVLALAVAAVTVGAVVHVGMVFLHVAPSNTLYQQHSVTVNDYVYPEFEQNWKLFAPNPVQQNTDVQARAEIRAVDGSLTTTGWVDLTAMDIANIRHNAFPSHTVQNELRRGWSFYTDTHDAQERAIGLRGQLSQEYVLRIVAHRFGPHLNGGAVQRLQLRSATEPVAAPPWSAQKTDTRTTYRVLPWWAVSAEDFT